MFNDQDLPKCYNCGVSYRTEEAPDWEVVRILKIPWFVRCPACILEKYMRDAQAATVRFQRRMWL